MNWWANSKLKIVIQKKFKGNKMLYTKLNSSHGFGISAKSCIFSWNLLQDPFW